MRERRWALGVWAGALVAPLIAVLLSVAAPVGAAQWYELYERGLEAERRGAWEEAAALFGEAESYRAEPEERVRTYGNRFLFSYDPAFHRARCLTELGRLDEAERALGTSVAAGVTPEAALAALGDRLERLRSRRDEETEAAPPELPAPGLLDIHSTPSGVRIEIDGQVGGTTPAEAIELPPGTHRVRLVDERPGSDRLPWDQSVEVLPGERVHLEVTLPSRPPRSGSTGGTTGAGEVPAGAEEPRQRRQRRHRAEPDRSEPAAIVGERGEEREAAPARDDGADEPGAGTAESETDPADPEEPRTALGAAGPEPGPTEPASGPATMPEEIGGADGSAAAGPDESAASPAKPRPTEPRAEEPSSPSERTSWDRARTAATVAGLLVLLVVLVLGLTAVRSRRRRRGSGRHQTTTGAIDRRIGGRIGGYRVEEVLGRGGMATTYRARRLSDRKEVALKIPHETGDPTYAERFVREGRLGETLHHPGIVRILEAGQDDGQAFLAMELLPGHTLREMMDSAEEQLPVERCLGIVREIAEALDYAHSKGVVHRDLKPENVMVLPDGALRVMDFGVARVEGQPGLTNSQFFFGSPVYAAPELVDPRTIDHRADLYSLGVLLFELLEGEPPFVHESIFKLLEMHQREPLPSPEGLPRRLPPAVWRLIARMLAKPREARYTSAQELLVDLNRMLHASSDEAAEHASPLADA